VGFLLSTPTRPERIFMHRFHEAAMLSSWGFLLLGSPVLAAYGLAMDAPWYYYVLLFPYMIAFAMIPAGLGAIACLLIVRGLARFRKAALGVLCLITLLALGAVLWSVVFGSDANLMSNRWFDQMLRRVNTIPSRLLPHWWLSQGMIEAARGEGRLRHYQPWAQALLFFTVLAANALLLHQIAVLTAGRVLRESYFRLHTLGTTVRQAGEARVDRVVDRLLRPLPTPTRLLLVKDFRIFRRDPTQWTQFLIFLGLVLLFFMAMPWLSYGRQQLLWIMVVSFLNLSVVGLILSTFTTRFIFPLISLEGRRFWVLGPLPISRDTILWGKFLFAALGTIVPCAVLILLSDLMLRIAPLVMAVHQLVGVVMCVGLAALAVGLGARMPDLRERNASKIAAGFGGTLNLVLSATFVLALVVTTAIPCYFYLETLQKQVPDLARLAHVRLLIAAACGAATLLGAAVTALSMTMGLRAFRRLEY
jgi:ABC-2 type transport system permease protein